MRDGQTKEIPDTGKQFEGTPPKNLMPLIPLAVGLDMLLLQKCDPARDFGGDARPSLTLTLGTPRLSTGWVCQKSVQMRQDKLDATKTGYLRSRCHDLPDPESSRILSWAVSLLRVSWMSSMWVQ